MASPRTRVIASDRYYAGAGNASTAIDVGGGYTILGDDESNVLRLYKSRTSERARQDL